MEALLWSQWTFLQWTFLSPFPGDRTQGHWPPYHLNRCWAHVGWSQPVNWQIQKKCHCGLNLQSCLIDLYIPVQSFSTLSNIYLVGCYWKSMICPNPQGPADPACNLVCPQAALPFGTAADSASAGAVHSTWSVAGSCLAAEIPPFLSTQLQPLPNSVYISLPINLGIWAGLLDPFQSDRNIFGHASQHSTLWTCPGTLATCVTCSDKQIQMLETSPQIPSLCRGQNLEVPFEGAAPTIFIHFDLVADMDLVFLQNSRTFPSTNSLIGRSWVVYHENMRADFCSA